MNNLKVGNYIVLSKKYPCKVIQINKSSPGKHGHSKYNVVGRDVLTDKRHNELFKHNDHYIEFECTKSTFMGISVDGDKYLTMLNDDLSERVDLRILDEVLLKTALKLQKENGEFNVEILKAIMPDKTVHERITKITK